MLLDYVVLERLIFLKSTGWWTVDMVQCTFAHVCWASRHEFKCWALTQEAGCDHMCLCLQHCGGFRGRPRMVTGLAWCRSSSNFSKRPCLQEITWTRHLPSSEHCTGANMWVHSTPVHTSQQTPHNHTYTSQQTPHDHTYTSQWTPHDHTYARELLLELLTWLH